jgi:hypothetical protein
MRTLKVKVIKTEREGERERGRMRLSRTAVAAVQTGVEVDFLRWREQMK